VVEGRGRGPTDTVAAENFEFEISSDTDDICLFLYIINTLWVYLPPPLVEYFSFISEFIMFSFPKSFVCINSTVW
jgi:hypothetical protein